jgi:hypothetical protein
MNQVGQKLVLNNIVSPYGLALFSYAFFLFACLIPPSVYTHYMHEPDLMFLDPATILFYSLCVAAFLAGVWFFEKLFPPGPCVERKLEVRISPATFLLIPLAVGVALSALSSILLVKNNPSLVVMLLAQQGGELRGFDGGGLEFEGTLRSSGLFLIGVVWWVLWRSYQSGLQGRSRRRVKFGLFLAVLTVFISSSLTVSRQPFVVAISGMVIFYLLRKVFVGQVSWSLVGKTGCVLVFGGTFFFFLVSWLRGGADANGQVHGFVGYTIASYNRMAALIAGTLRYQYSGKGIYLSNFLLFNHSFNRIIPFGNLMNVPDYFDWWASDFSSVGRAGLDASMISCGTFGDLYIEIGWFAPLYVFGYGLLYGFTWRRMREGRLVGILLYPYFACLILFWFGSNALFEALTAALIADAIILGVYEFLFVRQGKVLAPVPQVG